jgi:hypothetical protein
MRTGLPRAYAASGTDMGHTGGGDVDANWDPKDFGIESSTPASLAGVTPAAR